MEIRRTWKGTCIRERHGNEKGMENRKTRKLEGLGKEKDQEYRRTWKRERHETGKRRTWKREGHE